MTTTTLTYRCPYCGTDHEVEPLRDAEVITCTNPDCGKPFRAEVPSVKPILATAPEDRPPETELRTVKLDVFRRHLFRVGALGAIVVGALIGFLYSWVQNLLLGAIFSVAIGGYFGLKLFAWWTRVRSTTLVVTNYQTMVRTGILSTEETSIPHDQIDEVSVYQTWLHRKLGIGDLLLVWGIPEDRKRLLIKAIPDPDDIAGVIRTEAQQMKQQRQALTVVEKQSVA